MKVFEHTRELFELTPETEADRKLISQIDFARHITVAEFTRTESPRGGYSADGVALRVSNTSRDALVANSGREALRSLRNLGRLVFAELAQDGVVGTHAAQPQTQVSLAAVLEELQLMRTAVEALKPESVLKEVRSTHDKSPGGETNMVVGLQYPVTSAERVEGGAA